MKTTCCTIVCLAALGLTTMFGQQAPSPAPAMPPRPEAPPASPPSVSRAAVPFSLDFPGGTPGELVAAIEKAMGRPLNAIIPDELANTRLPALKMNNVYVSQLFQALAAASQKSEAVVTSSRGFGGPGGFGGPMNYQIAQTSCGFRHAEGDISDDTIWYFYVEKPVLPPLSSSAKVCRFYSLATYLDRDMNVDDITTAIETGWKMLGETNTPMISFHKDTKLLIAVGDPSKLETIDAALKALEPPKSPFAARGRAAPRPAEQPEAGK